MMEEFIGFLVMLVLVIFLPPYFLWFLGSMVQGEWLQVGIFQWSEGARILMAIWTLLATVICFICFCGSL